MDMQLPLRRFAALCVLSSFISTDVSNGQSLAQPDALVANSPTQPDAKVKPAACSEGGSGCCSCREPLCCPKCVTEEVEKSCWLVKSELVCIPGFRWPWECRAGDCDCGGEVGDGCACPPKCGRVRCVNVLEQHKYTCKECGYEWEVKCVRRGNNCDTCASADVANRSASTPRTAHKASSLLERLGLK